MSPPGRKPRLTAAPSPASEEDRARRVMSLYLLKPRMMFVASMNRELPDARFLERDTVQALVIRAESELDARMMAMTQAGDEVQWNYALPDHEVEVVYEDQERDRWTMDPTWLRSDLVTCEEIGHEGEPGVVVRHFEPG